MTLPSTIKERPRGCVAVAAVIAAVEIWPTGSAARMLSFRPAVGLGRISYGVYLWHWPLVLMIPVTDGMTLDQQVLRQTLRLLVTLIAATASYFLVEQPSLRSRRILSSSGRVVLAAVTACGLVALAAIPTTALPGSLATQLSHSADRGCPGERIDRLLTCTWPAGAELTRRPVRLALLGDSTARALSPGLDDWANRTGSTWLEAAWQRCTATGLLVLPNGSPGPDEPARACARQASTQISQALQQYRPAVVLIAEFWTHHQTLLVGDQQIRPGTPEHKALLKSAYSAVISEVARYGGRVVFLELPPQGDQLGAVVAAGRPAARARPGGTGQDTYLAGYNALLRSLVAADPGHRGTASTVSVTDVICPDGYCGPLRNGMLIRTDGIHYSIPFARYLAPILLNRGGVA